MYGVYTAILTPFLDGKIDYQSFEKMLEFQIESGVRGVVPCGTTGESPTLSHQEHIEVVDFVCQKVRGRIQVMAGTGSNSTEETIKLTKEAEQSGANSCLVVVPYYNKPTQSGLCEHFKLVASSVKIPIVIYNIPGRSVIRMEQDTCSVLSECKNIIAVKDALNDLDFSSEFIHRHGERFSLLSGNDSQTYPLLALGCKGVVSVFTNLFPKPVVEMVNLAVDGNLIEAQKLHFKCWQLIQALGVATNPIPIKEACFMKKLIRSFELRLPLTRLSEQHRQTLEEAINDFS